MPESSRIKIRWPRNQAWQVDSFVELLIAYGYLAALSIAAVLSITVIMVRDLTLNNQISALALAFWRDVFLVVTLLPVITTMIAYLLLGERFNSTQVWGRAEYSHGSIIAAYL